MKTLLRSAPATAFVSFSPTGTVGRLVSSASVIAALALFVLISPAVAWAQTFRVALPLTATLWNQCVPEDVVTQGQITVTIQQNFDEASGSHFDIHVVSKGKGMGVITGANYNFSEESENSLQLPGPPLTVAQEFLINHVLIADGPVPNFYFFVRVHTTLNAVGTPTAQITRFDTRCQ